MTWRAGAPENPKISVDDVRIRSFSGALFLRVRFRLSRQLLTVDRVLDCLKISGFKRGMRLDVSGKHLRLPPSSDTNLFSTPPG